MGSAAWWCVHVCHAGPQPAASLAPACLSRAVKKRQHQGSQVYAREISYFSKSTWLLLDSLDPDRFLQHVSLKRDNLQRTPALALSPFRGHKQGYGHDATKEGRELYTSTWEQSPGRWAALRFGMVRPERCFGDRQELLPTLPCRRCLWSAGFREPHKVQPDTCSDSASCSSPCPPCGLRGHLTSLVPFASAIK